MKLTRYNLQLLAKSALHDWKSRQGFLKLLSLARLMVCVTIGARYIIFARDARALFIDPLYIAYFLVSVLITYLVYRPQNVRWFDLSRTRLLVIGLDVILIDIFIFRTSYPDTELYLTLLLPLIMTAHFFPRVRAVWISFIIVASYFATLCFFVFLPQVDYSIGMASIAFLVRGFFLLGTTWIYRVQNNFPNMDEKRITSPAKLIDEVEKMLTEFNQSINFDSISVMLIYQDRLQIIACRGFETPEDIYKLEFPASDERYPNGRVIKSKTSLIVDPEQYPSFKEERYFSGQIRSWMGVPLISPSTGECFGMISIDSWRSNAFTAWDLTMSGWFAARLGSLLIESQLGPAALTQFTKRENMSALLQNWASLFSRDAVTWEDDFQAAHALADFGKELFHVEDCSIYFLRQKINSNNEKELVLHLIASSTIPEDFFQNHEIQVTGKHRDGLTGRAVSTNRTINLGRAEIEHSPYLTGYKDHLEFLFSKRSRQVMIIPFRDSKKRPQGAIKLENRMGQSSETRFTPSEEHIFSIFVAMAGLIIENIRQKHFINRQTQNIHNLRGILHPAGIKPLEEIMDGADQDGFIRVHHGDLAQVKNMINYSKTVLDGVLAVSTNTYTLETQGLLPAVQNYIEMLGNSIPAFKPICDRFRIESDQARDELPQRIRNAFFNIAREAVSNIVRHSNIHQKPDGYALVRFTREENTYHLIIEDNGGGFVLRNVDTDRRSFGLEDMYFQRDTILHMSRSASLDIKAVVGQGTQIHLCATLEGVI
jgi:hypothetical protein